MQSFPNVPYEAMSKLPFAIQRLDFLLWLALLP